MRSSRKKFEGYNEPAIVRHLNELIKSSRRVNASKGKVKAIAKVKDKVSSLASNLKGVEPFAKFVFFRNK